MSVVRDVLVSGGTGYVGRALCVALVDRGHRVRVLARPGSVARVAAGAQAVPGNALEAQSIAAALAAGDVLIQLVGTPHPGPGKEQEFRQIDLVSVKAAVAAATGAGVAHFVYVSVAQPAPVMQAYQEVRAEGERTIGEAGLTATVLRPWYVLGPGHRWPLLLLPVYAVASLFPPSRDAARRMGLVTLGQMVTALIAAVEQPPASGHVRVVDVPGIRAAELSALPR